MGETICLWKGMGWVVSQLCNKLNPYRVLAEYIVEAWRMILYMLHWVWCDIWFCFLAICMSIIGLRRCLRHGYSRVSEKFSQLYCTYLNFLVMVLVSWVYAIFLDLSKGLCIIEANAIFSFVVQISNVIFISLSWFLFGTMLVSETTLHGMPSCAVFCWMTGEWMGKVFLRSFSSWISSFKFLYSKWVFWN